MDPTTDPRVADERPSDVDELVELYGAVGRSGRGVGRRLVEAVLLHDRPLKRPPLTRSTTDQ